MLISSSYLLSQDITFYANPLDLPTEQKEFEFKNMPIAQLIEEVEKKLLSPN